MRFTRWLGGFAIACSVLTVACGDDEGGDVGGLVDQQIAVDQQQAMIECACSPGDCGRSQPTATEVACWQAVVERHAAELGPELRCEIARTRAQNECYADLACDDTDGWDACYDAGGDCDDHFTEDVYEGEFQACEPSGGGGSGDAGNGGAAGTGNPGSGGSSAGEGGGGARAGSSGGGAAGSGGSECASDADCVVCTTAVMNGSVQCCEPCGMVTSTQQCQMNQMLSGQCAAVLCPAIACASEPVARCTNGRCSGAPRL